MRIKWPTLLLKLTIWLGAELTLTVLGLDDLADYSEFIFKSRSSSTLASRANISLIVSPRRAPLSLQA